MRKVRVEDAVGMVLAHDLTKIVPAAYKGPAFKKGHIVRAEDIPVLKDIGKEHIYLLELGPGQVHEDAAARRLAMAVAGPGLSCTEPSEGRVNLVAEDKGLLRVNVTALAAVNMIENMVVATLHTNRVVQAGEIVAGVKVVPLVIEEKQLQEAAKAAAAGAPVLQVQPLRNLPVAAIVTGNEVFYGRIKDGFAPVFEIKLTSYGGERIALQYLPDDRQRITEAIMSLYRQGAAIIIVTGGMSVDPDDVTPGAIRATGANVVTYGSPVLPGAMFMLAYLADTAIIGLPACAMYNKTTVFDLIYPRLLAGERLNKADIARLGHGGLCRNCPTCIYPHCPFGKC